MEESSAFPRASRTAYRLLAARDRSEREMRLRLREKGFAEAVVGAHPQLRSYQPYWALRADLCAKLGRADQAQAAYDEAIAREADPAVIRFLLERRAALQFG